MIEFKILQNPYRIHIDFNSPDLKYPLDVFFTTPGGSIFWQTKINDPFFWVEGPNQKGLNVRVIDSFGNLVFSNNWSYSSLSDKVEKYLKQINDNVTDIDDIYIKFWDEGVHYFKPINNYPIKELIKNCSDSDIDKYTLEYIAEYGALNVRGGSFSKIKIGEKEK